MANNALNQMIANSLFKANPSLRTVPFDPQGTGFDYDTAIAYGMSPGPDQHWGSRVELNNAIASSLGYPEGTGIMLKGASHSTWDKALSGEAQAGFNVVQGPNGRYYSIPKQEKSDAWKAMQASDTEAASKAGLPPITSFSEEAPARARLQDAIGRLQATGIKVPHFIGTKNEPTGDRGVTMDMENLVKGLKVLESQAHKVGDLEALSNISKERAYWEDQTKQGMSAQEWKNQTGESDPIYPK